MAWLKTMATGRDIVDGVAQIVEHGLAVLHNPPEALEEVTLQGGPPGPGPHLYGQLGPAAWTGSPEDNDDAFL